jgi:hypothetical protein
MQLSTRNERIFVLAISAAAVGLRLVRLGELSLGGDEETTTFAAMALLEGWPPELPGGMLYFRGLPFTFLETLALKLWGFDEWSMRLVPVLAAGPRVFAAWWLARPFLGPAGGLAAAAILALAPLDVELSRNARMYSLFATFDLIFLAASVQLLRHGRRAVTAGVAGVLSLATHALGVAHAPLPLLAGLVGGVPRRRIVKLAVVSGVAIAAFFIEGQLANISYANFGAGLEAAERPAGPIHRHAIRLLAGFPAPLPTAVGCLAALGALILAVLGALRLSNPAARLVALAGGIAFAVASPILGGLALMLLPALERQPPKTLAGRAPTLLIGACVAMAGWAVYALLSPLPDEGVIERVAHLLIGLPAPNWFEFAIGAPAFFGLALIGALLVADRAARSDVPASWLMLIAAAFGPMLLSGMVRREEGMRFHLIELAPLIILALFAVFTVVRKTSARQALIWGSSFLIVLASVRPDQSLQALLRDHGPIAEPFAFQNVAPDHRGAAAFVAKHRAPSDWVVAEDSLQQTLYLGQVDLWLRDIEDSAGFLIRRPGDDTLREAYTGTPHVSDIEAMRAAAERSGHDVVWLITSGEVEMAPTWYRTPDTDAALLAWRSKAWFIGADGLTRVYRLVDGVPVPVL